MSTPTEIAERRAAVIHLARGGASNRQIATALGISKDTVKRDLDLVGDPRAPLAQRLARQVALANEAVQHACAAAQAVADIRPAYTLTDDETAQRWCGALRAAAEELAAQADAFAVYYSRATG